MKGEPSKPGWQRKLVYTVLLTAGAILAITGIHVWIGSLWLDPAIAVLAKERMAPVHEDLFADDDLKVFVCGSSSPLATPDRAKTCIGIIANGKIMLFDVGAGSMRNIENWGVRPELISRVFLTHFHSDHIADLDEVAVQSWIRGRTQPIVVYGGQGIDQVVSGYNAALALDAGYRNEYGTERYFPLDAATLRAKAVMPKRGKLSLLLREGALTISAFSVDHAPVVPALGYEIRFGDRRVVISGDTKQSPHLTNIARGADILFHEAQSRRITRIMANAAARAGDARMHFILNKAGAYHTASEGFADLAQRTKARRLVMYHLAPPPDNVVMKRIFLAGLPSQVTLAEDGQMFSLAPGSTHIAESKIETP